MQIERHKPYEKFGTVTSPRPGKQSNLSSYPGWEKRNSVNHRLHPACVNLQTSHEIGTLGSSSKDIATR
jgi:hypothetical protein